MATLTVTRGYNPPDGWASGETVTPTKLNEAQSPTVAISNIVNADISATAAIAASKLNLTGAIVNADISATAAIAGSKLAAGAIGPTQLASNAVETAKINNGAVTASKLSAGAVGTGVGFVRQAASNYIIMQGPDGTKVGYAWGVGSSTSTGGDTTVSFPITFSSAPSVTATVTGIIFGFTRSVSTGTTSTTGFTYQVRGPSANEGNSINWIAIGPVA